MIIYRYFRSWFLIIWLRVEKRSAALIWAIQCTTPCAPPPRLSVTILRSPLSPRMARFDVLLAVLTFYTANTTLQRTCWARQRGRRQCWRVWTSFLNWPNGSGRSGVMCHWPRSSGGCCFYVPRRICFRYHKYLRPSHAIDDVFLENGVASWRWSDVYIPVPSSRCQRVH